jgi:hypothetical protein
VTQNSEAMEVPINLKKKKQQKTAAWQKLPKTKFRELEYL